MKNLVEKVEQIVNQSETEKAKLNQLATFEVTLKSLQEIVPLDKPTYAFPQVDTIGKRTYSTLNKR
jgi:hypothetical protein